MWKCEVPHSTPQSDGLVTTEILWKSQSSSGDYDDNMNSETSEMASRETYAYNVALVSYKENGSGLQIFHTFVNKKLVA
jgi:hypothetical protein